MELNNLDTLKKFSKDKQSLEDLKKIVEGLIKERDQKTEQLSLLESAISNDYDGILITELNLDEPGPKIVYANEGFCKITGYSKSEVIGKTPRILQGPKTDRDVLDMLKKRLSEGKSFFGKTINYRKDGSEFVNQWDIHPLTDEAGHITHWVSYQHDISKRKRAEKQLMNTKIEFDNLRKESKRTVVDVDLEGDIVMANKAFRGLTGFRKDELKSIKVWDLFPQKYMKSLKGRFEENDQASFFGGQEFKGIIKHKSGVPIQVKGVTKIFDLKNKKLIRAEIESISLQKRIMKKLEKRNYNFSQLVERASEFSYRVILEDGTPVIKHISEGFSEVTGFSDDAVSGEGKLNEIIHKDDFKRFTAHLQKVDKGSPSACEYRLQLNNGNFIEVLDYGQPEWDESKENVVAIHGAVSVDGSNKNFVETEGAP